MFNVNTARPADEHAYIVDTRSKDKAHVKHTCDVLIFDGVIYATSMPLQKRH